MASNPTNGGKMQVGDIGPIIRIAVKHRDATGAIVASNLASATVMQVKLTAPSGEAYTQTAVFTTDGTNGEMEWAVDDATIYNALVPYGKWSVRGYLELPGWTGHTGEGVLEVLSNT